MPPIPSKSNSTFPMAAVQLVLGNWWDEKMSSPLAKRRAPADCRKLGGSVFDILPELASTQAVPVLLALSKVLSYEPDKKVIKRGGYKDKSDFVLDLSTKLESEWAARQTVAPPSALVSQKGANLNAQP